MILTKLTRSPVDKPRKAIRYITGFVAIFGLTYILILYGVNTLVPDHGRAGSRIIILGQSESWASDQIIARVPAGATTGEVKVNL